jgi:NAD(P)-dependent dehydrogenase (short-subunit alcohol dehydrogenase family)
MQRWILITGCSSGIGLEAARTLTSRGHHVIASARHTRDIEKLRSENLKAVLLDVRDSDSIEAGIEQTLEISKGRIDVLFNNAGFGIPGAVEDLTRRALKEQFETNLFGPFELIHKILPIMRRQGFGRIIQNSSVLGMVALPFRGAYNSSKFAMEGLTDTLRLELAGSNIDVSLIEPGPITSRFRPNALIAFKEYLGSKPSHFQEIYKNLESRLAKEGPIVPFTLPPKAVVKKVIHAIESPNPRARYFVTFPTYLLGSLKRILSTKMLDRILLRHSRREKA